MNAEAKIKMVGDAWRITASALSIHQRGRFLGFVEAPDEKAAIEEEIKVFGVTNLSSRSG
jgi:hypothetical protein